MGARRGFAPLLVQPKLQVGKADDVAEREADRVAEQVGRSPHGRTAGGRDDLGGLPVDAGLEARINRARAGGSALDASVRNQMEASLGSDFSDVRVHTDRESEHLNRALQARAFTTGSDLFFAKGQYAPGTDAGTGLLAHELTHVVQQGGVRRQMLHRTFDPKNPNIASISDVLQLSGGSKNKGVFLLTGEGGAEVVAKFVDEDIRRAQMADEMLDQAGMNSSGAMPYAMDVGKQITAAIRRLAGDKRIAGDAETAQKLERAADLADSGAKGVVLMRKAGGIDLADLLYGKKGSAQPEDKAKATKSGIDPVRLLSLPKFHRELGRLWAADGLLGSSDRMSVDKFGGRIQSTNLKVLADGTIHTFDSDTVLIGYEAIKKAKKQKDKSAANWTKWLIEGGRVWDLGIEAPGADTHNLITMFDKASRKAIFDQLVSDFKTTADTLDWSTTTLDFATFDAEFMAGITESLTSMVDDIERLIAKTREIGGDDKGEGAVDADALAVKAEYLKGVLPEMKKKGEVGDDTKAAARAKAEAMANQIVFELNRPGDLATFDPTLLPVAQRPGDLNVAQKLGRKTKRAFTPSSAKKTDSKRAKDLRKGVGARDLEGTKQDLDEVQAMANKSRRQQHAAFDIGLQHAVLAIHRRSVEFANADHDLTKADAVVTDDAVLARRIKPYLAVTRAGGYDQAIANFKTLAKGYKDQLNAKADGPSIKELEQAQKTLEQDEGSFEAAVDWVERRLKKAGVPV